MTLARKAALADGAPAWVREKRQPTKQELAAKHAADGGGMGAPAADSSYAFFNGDDGSGDIVVKRYHT